MTRATPCDAREPFMQGTLLLLPTVSPDASLLRYSPCPSAWSWYQHIYVQLLQHWARCAGWGNHQAAFRPEPTAAGLYRPRHTTCPPIVLLMLSIWTDCSKVSTGLRTLQKLGSRMNCSFCNVCGGIMHRCHVIVAVRGCRQSWYTQKYYSRQP